MASTSERNMGQRKAYISPIVFLLAIIIACVLCFFVYVLPYTTQPSSSTPTIEISNTTASTLETGVVAEIATPVVPTPLTEIIVWDWRVNRLDCIEEKREWIEIRGIEISGGVPPYKFEFKQKEILLYSEVIGPPENTFTFKNEILFGASFHVSTGSPINVKITSTTLDESPYWIGELFYERDDSTC